MDRHVAKASTAVLIGCALAGAALVLIVAGAQRRARGQHAAGTSRIRDAGPTTMRDRDGDWDRVDEASDESFPASDPPGNY